MKKLVFIFFLSISLLFAKNIKSVGGYFSDVWDYMGQHHEELSNDNGWEMLTQTIFDCFCKELHISHDTCAKLVSKSIPMIGEIIETVYNNKHDKVFLVLCRKIADHINDVFDITKENCINYSYLTHAYFFHLSFMLRIVHIFFNKLGLGIREEKSQFISFYKDRIEMFSWLDLLDELKIVIDSHDNLVLLIDVQRYLEKLEGYFLLTNHVLWNANASQELATEMSIFLKIFIKELCEDYAKNIIITQALSHKKSVPLRAEQGAKRVLPLLSNFTKNLSDDFIIKTTVAAAAGLAVLLAILKAQKSNN